MIRPHLHITRLSKTSIWLQEVQIDQYRDKHLTIISPERKSIHHSFPSLRVPCSAPDPGAVFLTVLPIQAQCVWHCSRSRSRSSHRGNAAFDGSGRIQTPPSDVYFMSSHSMGLFYHLSALTYPTYPISCLPDLVFPHAHVIAP